MTYQSAIGYNETGSLTDISPQPATQGVEPGRFTVAMDGHIYEDGFPTLELLYEALTATQLETLLAKFGFTGTTRSTEITIRAKRNHDREFSNWNAIIDYPNFPREGAYRDGYWRNVRFMVRHMIGLDAGAYY